MRGLRVGLLLAAAFVLDCGPELRTCDKGCVNGAVCDTKFNVCVYPRPDGGVSGGTGGASGGATAGGGAAGGMGGGVSTCVPACPASLECVGAACAPRYASLTLSAPTRAGASPVTITAQLTTAAGRTAADPAQLVLSLDGGVVRDDAGTAITVLQRVDAGAYQAVGAFPAMNGPRQLFATFADAGLNAAATTTVDVTAPAPVIELSAPPARTNPNDGGLVTLDVAAPGAFRRDESVTVTIDFPERDVAGVVVDLFSDGGGLQAMGPPDAGCVSRFDGGVCQQARVDLWRNPMRAFREVVGLSTRIVDDVGNGVTLDAGRVAVTRFKWERVGPFPLAVTAQGDLVFHLELVQGSPRLVSWRPDGTDRWSQPTASGSGFVSIGSQVDERAYAVSIESLIRVASRASNTSIPTQTFSPLFPLLDGFEQTRPPVIVTRGTDEIAYFPTAGAFFNCNCSLLHAWRLSDQASVTVDAGELPGYTLSAAVTDNSSVFVTFMSLGGTYPTDLVVASAGPSGFPPEIRPRLPIPGGVVSAAVAQTDLVYLGVRSVEDGGVILPISGATVLSPWVPVPVIRPELVIGQDTVFVSSGASNEGLCRLPIGATNPVCRNIGTTGSPIIGARPTIGDAPILYLASSSGVLAVDSSSLTVLWGTPGFARPFSIDCSRTSTGSPRAAMPGVLYAGSPTATAAIIVDSPGVDGAAKWPMAGHDPRNSGNSTTSLANFYCP